MSAWEPPQEKPLERLWVARCWRCISGRYELSVQHVDRPRPEVPAGFYWWVYVLERDGSFTVVAYGKCSTCELAKQAAVAASKETP